MRLRCLLVLWSVLTLASQGLAQGCEGWNTSVFFLFATPAEVESCLAAGADLNARTIGLGYTPLHWAVWFSADPAVIEALLDAGAYVTARDIDSNTPWDYAKDREELQGSDAYQRLSEAQALAADLESPAPCGEWNTREFFESATLAEVSDCLAAGADIGVRDDDGYTPLHLAAWGNGNPAVITALAAAEADMGVQEYEEGWTPLHLAARYNDNPAIITALVAAGADLGARDDDGDTPLHLAAWGNDNPAIITALADTGADVGAQEYVFVWTPLHLAARYNDNPAVITALVAAGADLGARDDDGDTPLHLAAWGNDNPAIITALADTGADVGAQE
ncbi:MAG: ankyrin repeat domain-containing protein, partial [Truepera sp.]|nr:ankyrin repeat domain-containing protein [Truepera sp.]